MAPGPPATRALATPTILPVPMVAASAVHSDWNWEMDWSSASVCFVTCWSWKMPPTVFLNQCPMWDNWKNFVRIVIRIPVPTNSTNMGTPHTKPLMALFTLAMSSTIYILLLCFQVKEKAQTPEDVHADIVTWSVFRFWFFPSITYRKRCRKRKFFSKPLLT